MAAYDKIRNITLSIANLRSQDRFLDALAYGESELAKLKSRDAYDLVALYINLIYAANDGGFHEKAIKYALILKDIDPNIPAVKAVLEKN